MKTVKTACKVGANARQSIFLEQVLPNEALSPSDYHRRFAEKVSERQSRRDLKELKGAGLVLREGGGAATLYRRTNRTLEEENRALVLHQYNFSV